MTRMPVFLVLLALSGCAPKATPPVQVPAVPDDLHTWSRPAPVESIAPQAPVLPPAPRPPAPNERLYAYEQSTEYDVPVQVGTPVDIVFEPGEILHKHVEGDTAPQVEGELRWQYKASPAETEYTRVDHLFFTCTHETQQQGVIAATSRRVYYLNLRCVKKTAVRAIRWAYPAPPAPPVVAAPPNPLPDPLAPHDLHVGYQITPPLDDPGPHWRPTAVVDDGKKMYLILPRPALAQEVPLVRELTVNGPSLVNARQVVGKHTIIVDKLAPQLELRYGAGEQAQLVTITRGPLRKVTCPGAPECPVWPVQHRGR